jgi:hypothetical protein
MVSACRSIARWLTRAARWVAILYGGIGHRGNVEASLSAKDVQGSSLSGERSRAMGIKVAGVSDPVQLCNLVAGATGRVVAFPAVHGQFVPLTVH